MLELRRTKTLLDISSPSMGTIQYALRRYLLVDLQYPFRLIWSLVTCDGSREAREDKGAERGYGGAARKHWGAEGEHEGAEREHSGARRRNGP